MKNKQTNKNKKRNNVLLVQCPRTSKRRSLIVVFTLVVTIKRKTIKLIVQLKTLMYTRDHTTNFTEVEPCENFEILVCEQQLFCV